MRIIDHVTCPEHDFQKQNDLSVCNAPYPRVLVSDLKETQFVGTEQKITALADDTAHVNRQDISQKGTPLAQNFACDNGECISQKEAFLAEEQSCKVLCNVEQVGDLLETEISCENNENTELEETVLSDKVACEDNEMAEPRETGIVNGLTSDDNGLVTKVEVVIAHKVTSKDQETGLKEVCLAEDGTWKENETLRQVPCEDKDIRKMEAFLAVEAIHENTSETEEKDTLYVHNMTCEDHENTGGNKACFGDKLIAEDMEANGQRRHSLQMQKVLKMKIRDKNAHCLKTKVTYENNSTRRIETLLVDEVVPRNSKESGQCKEFIATGEISESKDIRQKEAFLSDEGKCGDETKVRPMEVLVAEEGVCEHENGFTSEGIIAAEENTCKDEYSWQEESYPANDTVHESDQELGQRETLLIGKMTCENYLDPGQAQATLSDKELFESNQSFTKNEAFVTGDVICEKDDTKLQEIFLVDQIACTNSQLLKQESFLPSSIECEELAVDEGHNSSITTNFSCFQSLDQVLEVDHHAENVGTALDSSDVSNEILNTSTLVKEAAGSEKHSSGENDTKFNQRLSTENEVRERPENMTLEKESTKTGPLDRLCLERFMCHLEEFQFSADVWGAHPLGASSYVTCLGIVVTYLLMLLQLQPILSNASADLDTNSLLENDEGIFECLSK
ncbi:uncharacterized protein [Macrobrachium rosenbergii]|uniref:uncharacterized protein n=1 Tax=Macrobrachium rosenbergii TaxID=79674 RepID=UPI0034D6BF19